MKDPTPIHSDNHSHSHSLRDAGAGVHVSAKVKRFTYAALALIGALTLIGMVALWPDYAKVQEVADRTSYLAEGAMQAQGEVLSVNDECEDQQAGPEEEQLDSAQNVCQMLRVGIRSGVDEGHVVQIAVRGTLAMSGIAAGDRLELVGFPASGESSEMSGGDGATEVRNYGVTNVYQASGVVRHLPLAVLVLVFAVVVVFVGRLRGFFALLALGVAAGVVLAFMLPAIVAGGPAMLIGLVGSSAIMFVTVYFVHGLNMRATSALIGTLAGVSIITAISWISVRVTRLSGLGDEASGLLSSMASDLDFRGLLTASILIAGLGILNDVTISQASSVWELRAAAPQLTRREIYSSAMRIGRDHIASTVYTVFFSYVGAAISTIIVLYLYNRPALSLLTQEDIAIEIVRTMVGSIGLVLAMPITTAVAAMFVPAAVEPEHIRWSERVA